MTKIITILLLSILGVGGVQSRESSRDTTFVAAGNPVIRHKYTADPAALVYKDRFYLYTGNDVCPPKENRYVMKDWLVFSTSDMKTWTEHPVPLRATDFSWAKGDAWASQVIERNGKFYWYVAVEHGMAPFTAKRLGLQCPTILLDHLKMPGARRSSQIISQPNIPG